METLILLRVNSRPLRIKISIHGRSIRHSFKKYVHLRDTGIRTHERISMHIFTATLINLLLQYSILQIESCSFAPCLLKVSLTNHHTVLNKWKMTARSFADHWQSIVPPIARSEKLTQIWRPCTTPLVLLVVVPAAVGRFIDFCPISPLRIMVAPLPRERRAQCRRHAGNAS